MRKFLIGIVVFSVLLLIAISFLSTRKDGSSSGVTSDLKLDFKIGKEIEKNPEIMVQVSSSPNANLLNVQNEILIEESSKMLQREKVKFMKINLKPVKLTPPPEIIDLKPHPED